MEMNDMPVVIHIPHDFHSKSVDETRRSEPVSTMKGGYNERSSKRSGPGW